MNFIELNLPIYDLESAMNDMLVSKKIKWTDLNQICINTTLSERDNFLYGAGSLLVDWENPKEISDDNGNIIHVPSKREVPLKESDFTVICNVFKNTVFEEAYTSITDKYNVGRVRLMKSPSKTCLSWHQDDTKRIHYPIKTQEGCFMIIEEEIKHLPQNTWWLTNTLVKHTAMNASFYDRVHLVVTLLD